MQQPCRIRQLAHGLLPTRACAANDLAHGVTILENGEQKVSAMPAVARASGTDNEMASGDERQRQSTRWVKRRGLRNETTDLGSDSFNHTYWFTSGPGIAAGHSQLNATDPGQSRR